MTSVVNNKGTYYGLRLLSDTVWHVASAFYASFGGGGGAGGAVVCADSHAAGECEVAEQESQVGDFVVAGWWAAVDRYVGHEAGGADGRAVQADFDDGRFSDLRADAVDREAGEEPVDRAVDEHARGRSQPRPVLHAHGLRAESERGASELRVGDRARDGAARADAAGDSAVCDDRRGERRARVFGDDLRAVSGGCQRADSKTPA